jgi:hypothetical protein
VNEVDAERDRATPAYRQEEGGLSVFPDAILLPARALETGACGRKGRRWWLGRRRIRRWWWLRSKFIRRRGSGEETAKRGDPEVGGRRGV